MPNCSVCGEFYSRGRYSWNKRLQRPGHVDNSEVHASAMRMAGFRRAYSGQIRACQQCEGYYIGSQYPEHALEERHQLAVRGKTCAACGARYVAGTYSAHKATADHARACSGY